MRRTLVLFAGAALAAALLPAHASEHRALGDTEVFATVGDPGMPEGIAVRDGRVYVSTHTSVRGNGGGEEDPSKIFAYDLADGDLKQEITVEDQDQAINHGLLALAFDAAGRLYAVERTGLVLRFDLSEDPPAQETYATIPNLPACGDGAPEPCSPTLLDQRTFADYMAFDASGDLYVTDLEAAAIFRVRNEGALPRAAEIWYADARFDGIFGLNGIAIGRDGKLYFAMTGSQQPDSPAQGVIYTLPLVDAPSSEDLEVFHVFLEPATGPDGIAFGAEGRLYVALAGHNQVAILEPDGSELMRFPDPVSNHLQDVPYDVPASVAFDGQGSILVTNQSFFRGEPGHWVVFDAWVNDTALPLIEPAITP